MTTIQGTTRLLGVIGWPVSHTKSPAMQAAAIRAAGLDYAYVPLPVAPERVGEAVRGLRALGFRGCNVTIPHKQAVIPFLDEIAPTAEAIGAVNTIVVEEDGRLVGHNTDADGAAVALEEETGVSIAGRGVVVIGCGGAGRAVAHGCAARGAARLVLLNRSIDKAASLAADVKSHHPDLEIATASSGSADLLAGCDVFFQMTSLGMEDCDPLPLDPALVPEGAVGLEAVYAPLMTPWRKAAIDRGARIVDGLAMLVGQGARSFELWTGRKADIQAMRRAISTP